MRKLLVVYGTRPEAIKVTPLMLSKKKFSDHGFDLVTVFTGQHRQMVDTIHKRFGITPDFDLDIMKPGQSLVSITQATLSGLNSVYEKLRSPAGLFVQGDTTSCLAAGLSAFYSKIPLFHIEAGLRSHDILSPYPEEFNRRVVGLVAELNFAPTEQAANNLRDEGVAPSKIHVTGNTGIDTLLLALEERYQSQSDLNDLTREFITRKDSKLILVTAHRRESFGEPIRNIFRAISNLLNERQDIRFLFFAHPNPEVQQAIKDVFSSKHARLLIQPPQEYFGFLKCLKESNFIITDSGGLQEEAPALGKPVLVTRDTTERPEAIAAGNSILVGTEIEKITKAVVDLLENKALYEKMAQARNPFGDGTATDKIFSCIQKFSF